MRSKGKESTLDQILIAVTQANKRACRWQHNAVFGCCTVSSTACAVKAASRNVETPQGIQVPCEPLELSTTGHPVV
jgi:hypothetical protein